MQKTVISIIKLFAASLLLLQLLVFPCASIACDVAYAAPGSATEVTDDNGNLKSTTEIAEDKDGRKMGEGRAATTDGGYIGINMDNVFSSDGTAQGGGLWHGLVKVLQILTTAILLPIAIIYFTWRAVYLAIFCYIAHVDPLNFLNNERYTKSKDYSAKKHGVVEMSSLGVFRNEPSASEYNNASKIGALSPIWRNNNKRNVQQWSLGMNTRTQHALLVEVKLMVRGLIIVFAVWSLINIFLWIAVIALQTFGSIG